ncbi:MAG: hypothetical protein LBL35_04870 [Clostridiales bacterium]|jgi:hypothetical protein|nr:hypothetical protein [Clostridiales bacterium]
MEKERLTSTQKTPVTIAISQINPQKCSVTVSGTLGYFSSGNGGSHLLYPTIVTNVGATAIVLEPSFTGYAGSDFWFFGGRVSWEVVEYY